MENRLIINVSVKPFCSKTNILEVKLDETIVISLNAKPKNNEANEELIKFISHFFEVKKEYIEIHYDRL